MMKRLGAFALVTFLGSYAPADAQFGFGNGASSPGYSAFGNSTGHGFDPLGSRATYGADPFGNRASLESGMFGNRTGHGWDPLGSRTTYDFNTPVTRPSYASPNQYDSYGSSNVHSRNHTYASDFNSSYTTGVGASPVHVDGYCNASGTYVQPYYRTRPNDTVMDNYGTAGNYNPYTGEPGRRSPWADRMHKVSGKLRSLAGL